MLQWLECQPSPAVRKVDRDPCFERAPVRVCFAVKWTSSSVDVEAGQTCGRANFCCYLELLQQCSTQLRTCILRYETHRRDDKSSAEHVRTKAWHLKALGAQLVVGLGEGGHLRQVVQAAAAHSHHLAARLAHILRGKGFKLLYLMVWYAGMVASSATQTGTLATHGHASVLDACPTTTEKEEFGTPLARHVLLR